MASVAPRTYETASFVLRYPADWSLTREQKAPPVMVLGLPGTTGAFAVEAERSTKTIAAHQDELKAAAGAALIRSESNTLDGLRGFLVVSSQDTAGGKRRVTQRGYLYRGMFWKVTASWDPRDARADRITQDIDAIVRSYRWL